MFDSLLSITTVLRAIQSNLYEEDHSQVDLASGIIIQFFFIFVIN